MRHSHSVADEIVQLFSGIEHAHMCALLSQLEEGLTSVSAG